MGCCRKLLFRSKAGGYGKTRSVICLKYVLPIKLVTVISIWIDVIYALLNRDELTLPIQLFMLIHLIVAIFILLECRRSVTYHKLYGAPKEE